ncbi:MAG TPA: hypothetical protein VLT81_17755, partial [Chondromyces sp.]|nr:hypothetical protein [Chondromyces sp.]
QELTASLELLESLAGESLGAEQVAALRVRHTTAPAAEDGAETAEAAEPLIDETAYYRDLRSALVEGQPLDPAAIEGLGTARAEAIRAFLVDGNGIDPARVQLVGAAAVEEASGDGWVRCRLDVAAGG